MLDAAKCGSIVPLGFTLWMLRGSWVVLGWMTELPNLSITTLEVGSCRVVAGASGFA
jgi:hypothetical protein